MVLLNYHWILIGFILNFLKNLLAIQRSLVNYQRYWRIPYTAWKVSVFGVFLVRIFPHLDWIRRDAPYLSVFIPNTRKCGPEKLQIWTLFTQFSSFWFIRNSYGQLQAWHKSEKKKRGILPFPPALEPLFYYSWKSSGIIMKLFPRTLNCLKNHFEIKMSCRVI